MADFEKKLVLKEPPNKNPFIGVLFTADWEAKTNDDLVIDQKKHKSNSALFSLGIEIFADYCNLKITSPNPFTIRIYRRVKYDSLMLENWLRANCNKRPFNFGHIILKNGVQEIMKTPVWHLNFVLRLDSVTITSG